MLSTHHTGGDGESVGTLEHTDGKDAIIAIKTPLSSRIVILVVAVGTECITWLLILGAGVLWILASPTVDLVIRSTVSVMFVLNVDELIFESCCVEDIVEDVEETKYRIPRMTTDVMYNYVSAEKNSIVKEVHLKGHGLKPTDMTLLHGATSDPYLIILQKGRAIVRTKTVQHRFVALSVHRNPGSRCLAPSCMNM